MKIAVVDDHPLVRKGLLSVLSMEQDMEVVGEADHVEAALTLIDSAKPDVALIDIRLRKQSGWTLVEKLKGTSCKCVILTSSVQEAELKKAVQLDVCGYVLKDALPEELVYAIRLVAKGRKYYDPSFMEYALYPTGPDPLSGLTAKELEVLSVLSDGLSNREIARTLSISEFTVKKHISQIFAKLELTDRTQAALFARSNGLSFRR